jgi:hypothetical protein
MSFCTPLSTMSRARTKKPMRLPSHMTKKARNVVRSDRMGVRKHELMNVAMAAHEPAMMTATSQKRTPQVMSWPTVT